MMRKRVSMSLIVQANRSEIWDWIGSSNQALFLVSPPKRFDYGLPIHPILRGSSWKPFNYAARNSKTFGLGSSIRKVLKSSWSPSHYP